MPIGPIQYKQVFSASVNAGAQGANDVDVSGYRLLTVFYKLAGTVTTTDLTPFTLAYLPDGTQFGQGMPSVRTAAVAVSGSDIVGTQVFEVSGLSKVSVRGINNNAGAKVMSIWAAVGT